MNNFMQRRGLVLATLSTPLLTACPWPQFFDIGCDEDVQLHDGRVIVVKVKYTYERLGALTVDRYEPSILRNTEFSFDAGSPIGRFSQLFQKHRVNIVEYVNGKWYLLLQTRGGLLTVEKEGKREEVFGSMQNGSGYKCWSLDENGFVQASMNDLPDPLLKINMLMDYAPARVLAILDGTRVTLSQKNELRISFPFNPSDQRIERPQTNNAKLGNTPAEFQCVGNERLKLSAELHPSVWRLHAPNKWIRRRA